MDRSHLTKANAKTKLETNSLIQSLKGSFTPSYYVAVTVPLTGGAFHLDKQIKGAVRQCYGDHYVIARCE